MGCSTIKGRLTRHGQILMKDTSGRAVDYPEMTKLTIAYYCTLGPTINNSTCLRPIIVSSSG